MPPYLQLCAGSGARDESGLSRVELTFAVKGPVEADGDEPYDTLFNWLPTTKPHGLEYSTRTFAKQSDGDWELHLLYHGAPDDNAFGIVLELDYATVTSRLETHPKFLKIADRYRAKVEDGKLIGWEKTIKDPTTGKQVKNPMLGTEEFLETNPVLRVTFGARKFYPGIFVNCSQIQKPAVPPQFDEVVASPDDRTWLKRSLRARFYGNAWQYSVEYHLGLWAPDLYSASKDDGFKTAIQGISPQSAH